MRLLLYFFLLFAVFSCGSKGENSDYFYFLNEEIVQNNRNQQIINKIYTREREKFEKTGNKKFLISSKYVSVSLLKKNRVQQIQVIYDLLKANDNEYNYITTNCNYYLAMKFEKSLPNSALTYISNAIEADLHSEKKHHLPHLYHFKGRLLYNTGAYSEAISFFNKAMKIHQERGETMFVASMHNNLGMCYAKMGNLTKAIDETLFAIEMLKGIHNPNAEESYFLYYVKGGLSAYYKEKREYDLAKSLLIEEWNYAVKYKIVDLGLLAARGIYDLSKDIAISKDEVKGIVDSLAVLSPSISKIDDKVLYHQIKYDFYKDTGSPEIYRSVSEDLIASIKESKISMDNEREKNFEATDQTVIDNFNKDYQSEKRKNTFLIISVVTIILVLILSVIFLLKTKRKKLALIEKDIIIAEQEKSNLKENIKFQNDKLKNFHLMLNVKTETEKSFVEALKKIRKSKNVDIDNALKDLHLRINNVISLDSKSLDFVNESTEENELFKKKLAENFPVLSKNDLKFCVYFRLGLSSKEISLLEKVSDATVRVYKTKIKNKMGIARETGLTEYLRSY